MDEVVDRSPAIANGARWVPLGTRIHDDVVRCTLASQARSRTDARARSVEVRAAAPLGVCFLPAFVLIGVVPMVVGVFSAMRLFG